MAEWETMAESFSLGVGVVVGVVVVVVVVVVARWLFLKASPDAKMPSGHQKAFILFSNFTRGIPTIEQWSKPWLFRVYIGYSTTQLNGDYNKPL